MLSRRMVQFGQRRDGRVKSLLCTRMSLNANDPTARHLVPEDQQTALACDAQVRARHGLSLAFFAKHPAEPYRSRVGFSKLQIGSPVRSFFYWSAAPDRQLARAGLECRAKLAR